MASRMEELDTRLLIIGELVRQLPLAVVVDLELLALEDPASFRDRVVALVASGQVQVAEALLAELQEQIDPSAPTLD